MAFTTKLFCELPSNLASALKTWLDAQTVTTMHSISITKQGQFVLCLVVFE